MDSIDVALPEMGGAVFFLKEHNISYCYILQLKILSILE